jgi:hypothetical protein
MAATHNVTSKSVIFNIFVFVCLVLLVGIIFLNFLYSEPIESSTRSPYTTGRLCNTFFESNITVESKQDAISAINLYLNGSEDGQLVTGYSVDEGVYWMYDVSLMGESYEILSIVCSERKPKSDEVIFCAEGRDLSSPRIHVKDNGKICDKIDFPEDS